MQSLLNMLTPRAKKLLGFQTEEGDNKAGDKLYERYIYAEEDMQADRVRHNQEKYEKDRFYIHREKRLDKNGNQIAPEDFSFKATKAYTDALQKAVDKKLMTPSLARLALASTFQEGRHKRERGANYGVDIEDDKLSDATFVFPIYNQLTGANLKENLDLETNKIDSASYAVAKMISKNKDMFQNDRGFSDEEIVQRWNGAGWESRRHLERSKRVLEMLNDPMNKEEMDKLDARFMRE